MGGEWEGRPRLSPQAKQAADAASKAINDAKRSPAPSAPKPTDEPKEKSAP